MIDDKDSSESTLRLILWKSLEQYSTPDLLDLVEDPDYIVRTAAAKQLHFRPEASVFAKAVSLMSARDFFKREIGAFILGQLGTPDMPYRNQSIPLLVQLFTDRSADVRAAAVASIGHLGSGKIHFNDDRLLDKIVALSRDKSPGVRCCCAVALMSFATSPKVIETLELLLKDKNGDVIEWAQASLELHSERASPPN
jgi:HEAT repeat protein